MKYFLLSAVTSCLLLMGGSLCNHPCASTKAAGRKLAANKRASSLPVCCHRAPLARWPFFLVWGRGVVLSKRLGPAAWFFGPWPFKSSMWRTFVGYSRLAAPSVLNGLKYSCTASGGTRCHARPTNPPLHGILDTLVACLLNAVRN